MKLQKNIRVPGLIAISALGALCCIAAEKVKIDGYVGSRIESCIDNRVKPQDTEMLVEPFRHLTEGTRWQTEFVGKWMLGAIASYRYDNDPALLDKIRNTAAALMETQRDDGYIGNYNAESRLTNWDIWGRKYTSLSLLEYYRLTGDDKALAAVCALIDGLIAELDTKGTDIADTGLYRGMPSCSILEPVVYLYNYTGEPRYLDFARRIVASIEKEGSTQLVSKALAGVPVAHRFEFPKAWWSFENGHKAYEMMSCYVGLMELGKATGNQDYLKAAVAAADNIIDTEINIAGSGAAFECWYDGRVRQTVPAYHTMETCVTFTWMQLLSKLWEQTGDARYADQFERTMYNALMAALRADGKQISKYSPLEGRRQEGEEQCGLPINCCNANAPRAFAMIPEFAAVMKSDTVFVNLYLPGKKTFKAGRNELTLTVDSDIPRSGKISVTLEQTKPAKTVLALRVPEWSGDTPGYRYLETGRQKQYSFSGDFGIQTKVEELNGMQAVVRGPVVFARDSRYADGDVDECCVIQAQNGVVDSRFAPQPDPSFWLTLEVPAVLGTDLENPENSTPRYIKFCDFASAGNDWAPSGRYRVWLTRPINSMSQPYHKY